MSTVPYKGGLISTNSNCVAYQLFLSKDETKLDKHLKTLKENEAKLIKHYDDQLKAKESTNEVRKI